MSEIEEAYNQAIDAMPVFEKMARVESFLCWTRNLLARQVRAELGPDVSDERVRWEVALRMYDSDPHMAELIRQEIARVSP